MVKMAWDLLDVKFIAETPVPLEGDPCSKQWIRSCAQVTVNSCRPSIETQREEHALRLAARTWQKGGQFYTPFLW